MNLRVTFDFSLQQRDILARAAGLIEAGEGARARQVLANLRPQQITHARDALIATEMLLDVHLLDAALAAVERAGVLDRNNPDVAELHAECRYRLDLPKTRQADAEAIRAMLERLDALTMPSDSATPQHIHVVGKLDRLGGSETRALNLHRHLSTSVPATLWSTHAVHPAHLRDRKIKVIGEDGIPSGGTLVLIGTYFSCGEWLENERFDRVVICHNLAEQSQSLVTRLGQVEKNPAHPRVRLTFPSRMFRDMYGLPGFVEYSPVDLDYLQRDQAASDAVSNLTIGRHGRAFSLKFHPNDPSFFRELTARGDRVRLLGGKIIERTFAHDGSRRPELIDVGAITAKEFLASLDIFVYRKHPQWLETGGSVILEAMAMEVPVVVFPEQCGIAELIVHGENGYIVTTEAEAFAAIERLRADPGLRRRIGAAARRTLFDLQQKQLSDVIDYYCH